ncbi:MAG: methionyl-tRNA formyltransferase [Clostridiales bacterium]|jgi:methionyl-tRNA formyltransferase|nr:methionyl-tRNA formyltransferase [Clostridiales bacterium]HOA85420.1 methionyl-tRNA formyltransferase [Bacillota bacterium]
MKILFMGTPDFAIFPLSALFESGENIVGVVTQPDRPVGRKYKLTPPPVKVWATEHGIPVYQPETLKDEKFSGLLAELDPELIVVAAYGKILPRSVLDYPKFGCINVHASLLPEYRGAAPIQRAIIDGKSVTGVTIMQMDAGLDTGDILLAREVPIHERDNFETLHDRLGEAGAAALLEALGLLKEGRLTRIKQDHSKATYAAKIEKCDCLIDFSKPARDVHNHIRALSPTPLAFTRLPDGCVLKVPEAEVANDFCEEGCGSPGTVISLERGIVVACRSGAVRLLRVLPKCKCCMCAEDFVRGRRIAVGDKLS